MNLSDPRKGKADSQKIEVPKEMESAVALRY